MCLFHGPVVFYLFGLKFVLQIHWLKVFKIYLRVPAVVAVVVVIIIIIIIIIIISIIIFAFPCCFPTP